MGTKLDTSQFPAPVSFEQHTRDFLLVGDTWTITHVSDPTNKRMVSVKAANGDARMIDITPDNISNYIQEDSSKTDFIQVLDRNANPIDVFSLKNLTPGVIASDGLQFTSGGSGYVADSTWALDGGDNNATVYVDTVDENGAILTFHLVNPGSNYEYNTYGLEGGGPDPAYFWISDIVTTYDTSKGWYVSTTNASQLDSSSWTGINNLRFDMALAGSYSQSIPVGTQIKYLISVDSRATWKSWNGSAWVTVSLVDIDAQGITQDDLIAVTPVQWALLFVAGTFDIVASLKTTDVTVTPFISEIEVNYITPGYQVISLTDILIQEMGATTSTVKNISNDTLVGLKANILVSQV